MSRLVVTGASGFLGRHLVRHALRSGDQVIAVHRRGSDGPVIRGLEANGATILRFDTAEEVVGLTAASDADAVFHLATLYLKSHAATDIGPLLDANVAFGTQVLEGLRGTDTPFVTTMSYFQYLDGRPSPFSLYSATKQAFSDIADFYRSAGTSVREVVVYDTYGPDDERPKLMPLLRDLAVGRRDSVRLGAPGQRLDFRHVDDVVTGLRAAAGPAAPPRMSFRGDPRPLQEIVDILETAAGRRLGVEFDATATVNDRVDRAEWWPAPPGWRPAIDLRVGLSQLIASGRRAE